MPKPKNALTNELFKKIHLDPDYRNDLKVQLTEIAASTLAAEEIFQRSATLSSMRYKVIAEALGDLVGAILLEIEKAEKKERKLN
jgi:hypothetical protein